MSLAPPAMAAGGQCPTHATDTSLQFDNADCDDPDPGTDTCQEVGGTWTCDVSGAAAGATAFAVEDFDTTTGTYEAWGNVGGTLFCCQYTEEDTNNPVIDDVVITGSVYGDQLKFNWFSNAYNLQPTVSGHAINGTIDAGAGDDTVKGSASTSANYDEYLNGDAGEDSINGHAGDDNITGGAGDDTLIGAAGDDVIDGDGGADTMFGTGGVDVMVGGEGDDVMSGGVGDDTMDGKNGDDRMSGGDGDDTMDGGLGDDSLCGDSEVNGDSLDDGDNAPGTDRLWSANAVDSLTTGNASTLEDNVATSCTGPGCGAPYQGSRPASCP